MKVEAMWDGRMAGAHPPADHYRTDEGMDELLESIQHDEICADGRELIVHDVSIDLGTMPRINDGWLIFKFHYDVENEEAKSIRELQSIALDGIMFWCNHWSLNIMVNVVEVKHS